MKKYLKLWFACAMFLTSTGFVLIQDQAQAQEKQADQKVKPLDIPDSSTSDGLMRQLDELKRDFASEKRKNDSINTVRTTNSKIAEKSLADLKKANAQYKKSLARLKFVLEKFDADSVMKYYGEYKEPDTTSEEDSKKKTETAVVVVTPKKKNLFQRIFKRNR